PVIAEHIVRTPGTCHGKPRIAGTRIKVDQVVVWHERMGMTPAKVVAKWPHLTLGDVHAALAYYHDRRAEIDADLAEGERRFEARRARRPPIGEEARRRRADAPHDLLPPRGPWRPGGLRGPRAGGGHWWLVHQ